MPEIVESITPARNRSRGNVKRMAENGSGQELRSSQRSVN
jgi:hypothetical protein